MGNFKPPDERASEYVGFRLTMDDRLLLDHLAKKEGLSLTDLLRSMLRERAVKLGVKRVPAPKRKRRGRLPKKGAKR